jgi:hypothetical protein
MMKLWNYSWSALVLGLVVAAPGMATLKRMPMPGSLNSVEGEASLNAHPVPPSSIAKGVVRPLQVLQTQRGKAELLLTPGVFLRIGDNSAVRMLSPSLENSEVNLMHGKALLTADAVFKHAVAVVMDGATTTIDQKGLYGFNAHRETIGVLKGKATVRKGDSQLTLKKGREISLAGGQPLMIGKLNKQAFESGRLFRWNNLRNKYESRARQSVQQAIARKGGWYGPGWYWSPFWGFYAYLSSGGSYFSPYYSPYYGPYGWSGSDGWGWGGWGGWGDDDDGD